MSPWSSTPAQRARSQALVAAGREADRLLEQARRFAVFGDDEEYWTPEEWAVWVRTPVDGSYDMALADRFDAAPTLDQCLRDARGES